MGKHYCQYYLSVVVWARIAIYAYIFMYVFADLILYYKKYFALYKLKFCTINSFLSASTLLHKLRLNQWFTYYFRFEFWRTAQKTSRGRLTDPKLKK